MGKKEKLIKRLKTRPRDFSFAEAETLLLMLEFERNNRGRTSGSRVMYAHKEHGHFLLHIPHPGNELRFYQVKQLIDFLEQEGLI